MSNSPWLHLVPVFTFTIGPYAADSPAPGGREGATPVAPAADPAAAPVSMADASASASDAASAVTETIADAAPATSPDAGALPTDAGGASEGVGRYKPGNPLDWGRIADRKDLLEMRAPCGDHVNAARYDSAGVPLEARDAFKRIYDEVSASVHARIAPSCGALGSPVSQPWSESQCIGRATGFEAGRPAALLREVVETRAGRRPSPPSGSASPAFDVLMAVTGSDAELEVAFAKAFGPAGGKRFAYIPYVCTSGPAQ